MMIRCGVGLIGLLLIVASTLHAQTPPVKIQLDGEWVFKKDPEKIGLDNRWWANDLDRSDWESVPVPKMWEEYPTLGSYDGWGWFALSVVFQKTGQPMTLHFAGVDDDAVVWVNGVEVGTHVGYSDPFGIDVTNALRNGENLVIVKVADHRGGGGIYRSVTLIETRSIEELLKSPFFGTPAIKSPDWVRDAVIYEVYLRSFSPEGTFAGLEKKLPELKALGVTVLWLMPIHPVGEKNRKGTLGSPYSVKDYYGINPEFGTMKEFKKLLSSAHKKGMKLIIDLVINHTAWDNPLIEEHPDWYSKNAAGAIVPPNDDWTDVADLDFSQADLRKYMADMMRWWVKDIGIDGFRCDVAEMVPTDFWNDVRKQLNKVKSVMMLAEGSLPEHHAQAFDVSYAWTVYDVLESILKARSPATAINDILKNERLQFPTGSIRMRFNTNHDKNAWEDPAVTKLGLDGLKLSTVLVHTLPGIPLIYNGEEVANHKKLGLFEKVDIDWDRPSEIGQMLAQLCSLRQVNKSLSRGEFVPLATSSDQDVLAYARLAGKDKVVVVLNFSEEPRFVQVETPLERIVPGRKDMVLTDLFKDEKMEVKQSTGEKVVLALEPRDFRVFQVK